MVNELQLELERLERSAQIAGREAKLLRYLVENALGQRSDPLTDREIAIAVFDRPASFVSKDDPVVRIEVARLRARLERFYLESKVEPGVFIRLPPRKNRPVFEFKES